MVFVFSTLLRGIIIVGILVAGLWLLGVDVVSQLDGAVGFVDLSRWWLLWQ